MVETSETLPSATSRVSNVTALLCMLILRHGHGCPPLPSGNPSTAPEALSPIEKSAFIPLAGRWVGMARSGSSASKALSFLGILRKPYKLYNIEKCDSGTFVIVWVC